MLYKDKILDWKCIYLFSYLLLYKKLALGSGIQRKVKEKNVYVSFFRVKISKYESLGGLVPLRNRAPKELQNITPPPPTVGAILLGCNSNGTVYEMKRLFTRKCKYFPKTQPRVMCQEISQLLLSLFTHTIQSLSLFLLHFQIIF